MTFALIALSLLVCGEALVIHGLLNRLLLQAKVPPLTLDLPKWRDDAKDESPAEQRRKLFSVDIPS